MQEATDTCAHCGGPKAVRNPSGACDHLYWPDCLSYEARIANGFEPTRDQILKRQQQVIDLLMKAVEPFAKGPEQCFPGSHSEIPVTLSVGSHYMVNYLRVGDLRRAREAKVEADRILSPREKTDD